MEQCSLDVDVDDVVTGTLLSLNPEHPHIRIDRPRLLLGRREDCDVRLADMRVSGHHCEILVEGGRVYVRDLSSNGTWINRSARLPHGEMHPLEHSDELSLVLPRSPHLVFATDCLSFVFQSDRATPSGMFVAVMQHEALLHTYHFVKELGTGTFGTVWLALHKATGTKLAAKIIRKREYARLCGSLTAIFDEVRVLERLRHPNVISVHGVYDTPKFVVIMLEFADGGDLSDVLKRVGRMAAAEARRCIFQVLSALEFLHEQDIAHRDLKPENIMLSAVEGGLPIVKIADFGLAKALGDRSMMTTICGTPLYIAPEILAQGVSRGYSKAVDVWSAGMILYQLLCGGLPFKTGDRAPPLHLQLAACLKPGFSVRFPSHVPEQAQDLLRRMLCPPEHRITAVEALQHHWMLGEEALQRSPTQALRLSRAPTSVDAAPVALASPMGGFGFASPAPAPQ